MVDGLHEVAHEGDKPSHGVECFARDASDAFHLVCGIKEKGDVLVVLRYQLERGGFRDVLRRTDAELGAPLERLRGHDGCQGDGIRLEQDVPIGQPVFLQGVLFLLQGGFDLAFGFAAFLFVLERLFLDERLLDIALFQDARLFGLALLGFGRRLGIDERAFGRNEFRDASLGGEAFLRIRQGGKVAHARLFQLGADRRRVLAHACEFEHGIGFQRLGAFLFVQQLGGCPYDGLSDDEFPMVARLALAVRRTFLCNGAAHHRAGLIDFLQVLVFLRRNGEENRRATQRVPGSRFRDARR